SFDLTNTSLHETLGVLGGVVIGVLAQVAMGPRLGDAGFDRRSTLGLEMLALTGEFLVSFGSKPGGLFLHERETLELRGPYGYFIGPGSEAIPWRHGRDPPHGVQSRRWLSLQARQRRAGTGSVAVENPPRCDPSRSG